MFLVDQEDTISNSRVDITLVRIPIVIAKME